MFKTGDVVMLKSGSPNLTVIEAGEKGVRVVYFDGPKRIEEMFPEAVLVAVPTRFGTLSGRDVRNDEL